MIVAGIMSGTSADGIDVAIVRLEDHDFEMKLDFVTHKDFPYPKNVHEIVLSVMNAEAKVSDLARLNLLLGELYAEAVIKTAAEAHAGVSLIGCHGQTIYHQGEKKNFLGRPVAATWQTGEGADRGGPYRAFQPSPISAKPTWPLAARARPGSLPRLHALS